MMRRIHYYFVPVVYLFLIVIVITPPRVNANTAAGLETCIGIQGRDFVLLGADTAVGPGVVWTATRVDKIASLGPSVAAAVVGDAADADALVGLLQAQARLHEYTQGFGGGEDNVQLISATAAAAATKKTTTINPNHYNDYSYTVSQMAQLARTQIASQLRTRTPCRVCLLVAGIQPGPPPPPLASPNAVAAASWTQRVQTQVQQATLLVRPNDANNHNGPSFPRDKDETQKNNNNNHHHHHARLYWLDELGTLLQVPYAAHGIGSMFMHSILDDGYHADLTKEQARALMLKCFAQLRQRYAVQAPQPPCLKCIDCNGVHLLDIHDQSDEAQVV